MTDGTLLQGERVRLRPLAGRDLPYLCLWEHDPLVSKFWGQKFGYGAQPEVWLDDLLRSTHRLGLAIETEAGSLIGDLQLEDIDYDACTAELRICIGVEASRGKGYGTEAVALAAQYAFTNLQLQAVHVRVALANWRAIRCFHKCGFKAAGILTANARRPESVSMALMVLKRDH